MIQSMIDAAAPGSTIVVPTGAYDVDAVNAPIMLKSNITLDLSQTTLKALPTDKSVYGILQMKDVENVTIIGGRILGERDRHLVQPALAESQYQDGFEPVYEGGWGMGIVITDGSKNIKVVGTAVSRCYGDGLYVDWGQSKKGPSNILIDGVICDGNRRQGASIICVDGLRIRNSQFSNNGLTPFGTIPGAGIDFECDPWPEGQPQQQWIINIVIEGNNKFFGNRGSAIGVNGSPGIYKTISIQPGNQFDKTWHSRPIWVGGGLDGGTPWWAIALNRAFGWSHDYKWWGYPTSWNLP